MTYPKITTKETVRIAVLIGILVSTASALAVHYRECSWGIRFGPCGLVAGWPIEFARYNPTVPQGVITEYFNPLNRLRIPLFMGLPYGYKDWSWILYALNSLIWAVIAYVAIKVLVRRK